MELESYFSTLKNELNRAYATATEARKKGYDPVDDVEVRIAQDVAARVEGIVGPPNIAKIIRDMEKNGMSREDIAFEIARKIAGGEIIKGNKEFLIEQAVRTGVGILTEGVLVAPTEGIAKVRIKNNPDGSDYVAVYYAGPIRSAGGTAAALSVVLADIARRVADVGDYRATDTQIERYVEEINAYEARVTHLQYLPPEKHLRTIIKNCPVCVDGDPTEEIEVSAYKNVPGIETDRIRGGVPLVVCEGIGLKAGKLLKYTNKLKLGWNWLENIIKIKAKEEKVEIKPDNSYLDGLVAGRPVFSYPSAKGGFRLRYGRSETNGLMGRNIHPATMTLVDDFLAYGTHMKVERPGKGCVVVPHSGIEGPVVRLKNGNIVKVKTVEDAAELKDDVDKILFLGDMLIAYGDFLKSNHPLMPSGYCKEIWELETSAKGVKPREIRDAADAFEFSRKNSVPLHPDYTLPWHDISIEELKQLRSWLKKATKKEKSLSLNSSDEKIILEKLLAECKVVDEKIILDSDYATILLECAAPEKEMPNTEDVLEAVNKLSGVEIKAWSPTYIGARMGRPEKAKERIMDGSPNVLFPTGSAKNRSLIKEMKNTKGTGRTVNIELARYRCKKCGKSTFFRRCHICNGEARLERICKKCGVSVIGDVHCGEKTAGYDRRPVDLVQLFESIKLRLGFTPEELKGVKGLSNAGRIAERIEKGFLRSKYDVYVFRDGTSRFDATDVPITHFTLKDIGLSVEKAKELGYTKDYQGKELKNENQVVLVFPQDIILSKEGVEYLIRVSKFIDEMLINVYGVGPYYKINKPMDLIGHAAVGLSPHTSAGALCRIIGYTDANVGYAHPFFHAAKRRNCFSGDTKIPIFENGQWKIERLDCLVENNLENPEKDDGGTLYCKLRRDIKTLTFNQKNKKFETAPITHISKHQVSDTVILRSKSGREITVTADHPFPSPEGKKTALNLDKMYIPAKIEIPDRDIESFDLSDYTEDVMVKIKNDIFADKNKKEFCRERNLNYKTFTNYVYRGSYPLELAEEFADVDGFSISAKRDGVAIKPKVECSDEFMQFLGIYLAEGHIRRTNGKKSVYQLGIAAANARVRKAVSENIRELFGNYPSENKNGLTICSRIIASFIENLGCGRNAREKKIPSFVFSLPKNKVRALLSGLYTGDGSVSISSTLEVNLSTVSRELVDGISFLLSRLGIIHSISTKDDKNPKHAKLYQIRSYGADAARFIEEIGFFGKKQEKAEELMKKWKTVMRKSRKETIGDIFVDTAVDKKTGKKQQTYSLTVSPHHTVIANGIVAHQCDGDEDSVMLLLDALINFSRRYLDEKRGGTMDSPLVLTTIMNPKEIDDEAHCVEIVSSYPLEFYRACERYAWPYDVKIKTVKDVLGKDSQFRLPATHLGTLFKGGNTRTAYVKLESVPEKVRLEFGLHNKIRAVDKTDAAERLILSHFIPDLYGNLRSYSRQIFRCVNCNTKYRRVPLSGRCMRCGGNLLLTINKGGIQKYLKITKEIIENYHLPDYMKQRINLIEKEINNIFEDEKEKQLGLVDFV